MIFYEFERAIFSVFNLKLLSCDRYKNSQNDENHVSTCFSEYLLNFYSFTNLFRSQIGSNSNQILP